ncbi:MAG: hypothetical protein NC123_15675 [Butyrivibrio sp.]|nr:hypothetical protein [Acetatifactor muris]MCM1560959.1 hypothetical protein [Butyrivibrio sp.]
MKVNELLIEAGRAIGYPVAQDIYEGSSAKSITFTYEDEQDTLVADNEGKEETAYLMVSMNTPQDYDYFGDKAALKKELQKRGFNVEHIQSWLETAKIGTKRIRRTIFTVNITMTIEK